MGLILYYGVLFTGQGEVGNWIFSYGLIDVFHRTSGAANDKSIGLKTSFSWHNQTF